MSRSYKKYPQVRRRTGLKKQFRTAYNRYMRHSCKDWVNGGHYRKICTKGGSLNYSYEFRYESRHGTMERFDEWYQEYESSLALGDTYYRSSKWFYSKSYEQRRLNHWKEYYAK